MGLRRMYPDERAIPVRVKVGSYLVRQWYNPDENLSLVMATFPVVDGRIQDGHMPILNMATQQPEMVSIQLNPVHDRRAIQEPAPPDEGPYPVDVWERPLWLVYLALVTVLAAAGLALFLLLVWLRLRS